MKRTYAQLGKKCVAAILAFVIIFGTTGHIVSPQKAHATDYEHFNTVVNTISKGADVLASGAQVSIATKEYGLDVLAFSIAKLMLKQVTRSIVRWINSGFQGSPAFVTDLEGFLRDSADKIIGELIYGSELSFLCSPFELDVRIALSTSVRDFQEEIQCTLSDVVDNIDGFFQGDFLAGGLPGWFEVTQNPNNNFYGAQASAKAALRGRLADGREVELNLLNFGNGFISKEGCVTVPGQGDECTIELPGRVISETLTFELSVGERTLIEADEINEIISALFVQLAKQAVTGAGGLLGLTRSGGNYGNVSYIDKFGDPAYDTNGGARSFTDIIESSVGAERQYRTLHTGIITETADLIAWAEELESPSRIGDNDAKCEVPDSITDRLAEINERAKEKQDLANANITTLSELRARYDAATTQATSTEAALAGQQAVLEDFQELQADGGLRTSLDVEIERSDIRENIEPEIRGLERDIEQACGVRRDGDNQGTGDGDSAGDGTDGDGGRT